MVPDNLRGLLRELPSLPSQHAILMGWASELPVLVKMKNLTKEQQPHSDDLISGMFGQERMLMGNWSRERPIGKLL
jgi:hypothetical protein